MPRYIYKELIKTNDSITGTADTADTIARSPVAGIGQRYVAEILKTGFDTFDYYRRFSEWDNFTINGDIGTSLADLPNGTNVKGATISFSSDFSTALAGQSGAFYVGFHPDSDNTATTYDYCNLYLMFSDGAMTGATWTYTLNSNVIRRFYIPFPFLITDSVYKAEWNTEDGLSTDLCDKILINLG